MGMSSKSPPSCSTKGSPWSAAMTSRVTNYSRLQTDKWSACRQRMATTDLEQWRRWVRSYIVQADGKTYRRNRRHILPVAEPPSPQLLDDPDQQDNSPPTVDSSPPHKCQHHTRCNHNTHHHPSSSPKRPHPLRFKTHNTPHTQVAPANQIPNTCEKRKKKKRRKNNPIYPACLILGHLMKLNSLSV